jgi:histidyl-tRNA synthetase
MSLTKPQILKGTRDFLPEKLINRQNIIEAIRRIFESFGFSPIDTPAFEYLETLEGKYGQEGEKLIYKFTDHGGRKIALRYDLTVPLSRVIAMYPEITKPFKRYQIAPVWRADKPQKGRYREFYQCDVDIIGSESMLCDAEVIAVSYYCLKEIGFDDFIIKINNRKILNGIVNFLGMDENKSQTLFRIIDKLDKIGMSGVEDELMNSDVPKDKILSFLNLLKLEKKDGELLLELENKLENIPQGIQGLREIREIMNYLDNMGVEDKNYEFDLTLARGLDYYTGPIFEVVLKKPKIGSISAGGRYDSLIGVFSKQSFPATGISIGLERIITVMEEFGMLPSNSLITQVLVTVFNQETTGHALSIATKLRLSGINTEIVLKEGKLSKQLNYANNKGIPICIIIGPDEIASGEITLKDMVNNRQEKVSDENIIKSIKNILGK